MVEFLADYLASDLGSDERSRIEGHLADCAECLAYFRSYRATVWAVRALRTDADERPGHVLDARRSRSLSGGDDRLGEAGNANQFDFGGAARAWRGVCSERGVL